MVLTSRKDGRKDYHIQHCIGHVRGERSRGRQRKRWMDNVREDLQERDIQLSTTNGKTKKRQVLSNIIRASSSASCWKRKKKRRRRRRTMP